VHSECDEGVEQNKSKPDEYVCLACKNRDSLPVCYFFAFVKLILIWSLLCFDTLGDRNALGNLFWGDLAMPGVTLRKKMSKRKLKEDTVLTC